MIKKHSGLRATLATLIAGLVCTSCSVTFHTGSARPMSSAPASGAAHPQEHPSAPPLPRLLGVRDNPLDRARPPVHPTSLQRTFVAGVDDFCHNWYSDKRSADERYPSPSMTRAFAALEEEQDRVLTQQLGDLTPPSDAAEAFAQFVANEQRMVQARVKEASADPTTRQEGGDEEDTALVMRHGYARQLGARLCDGMLPHQQEIAVERAAQRFDLTTSTQAACRTLVTRTFLAGEWGDQPGSPLARCGANLRDHLAAGPHRNIRVTKVTGVEGVSANVFFTEVPDCGCGTVDVRLYLVHGRWLVAYASTE